MADVAASAALRFEGLLPSSGVALMASGYEDNGSLRVVRLVDVWAFELAWLVVAFESVVSGFEDEGMFGVVGVAFCEGAGVLAAGLATAVLDFLLSTTVGFFF